MPFLQPIPFKKELIIGLAFAIGLALYTYVWYNKGFQDANQDTLIKKLEDEIARLEIEAQSVETTTVIVTEYKDRIIEVEKKVPVYVESVEEIFKYDDSVIIPADLARLHDKMVCDREARHAYPACGTINGPPAPVTLGQFSKTVISNYGKCEANSEQLISLSEWVRKQDALINKK